MSIADRPGRNRPATGEIWGIIVTYARPRTLESMLSSLARQTRTIDHLLVVDNDSDAEVAEIASRFGAQYLDSGGNLGPAGGNALGVVEVLSKATDEDWILFVDDDDEPFETTALEELLTFGSVLASEDPLLGGVGVAGSRYRHRWGIFRRLDDRELTGVVDLDVIFGGSLPMYRARAVRTVGPFDSQFFWGFEEGEFGLRMRSHGYRLAADGAMFLRYRHSLGTTGIAAGRMRTPREKDGWRRYYSVRNSTTLARRFGGPIAPLVAGVGGGLKGALTMARAGRSPSEALLPLRGTIDGLFGRLGKRVDPGRNAKVSP